MILAQVHGGWARSICCAAGWSRTSCWLLAGSMSALLPSGASRRRTLAARSVLWLAGLMAFTGAVDPGMVPEELPDRPIERSYKSSQPLGCGMCGPCGLCLPSSVRRIRVAASCFREVPTPHPAPLDLHWQHDAACLLGAVAQLDHRVLQCPRLRPLLPLAPERHRSPQPSGALARP